MLVERHNEAAALQALNDPFVNTRVCVSVKPDDTVLRFVRDTTEITVGGMVFSPVPFAKFDPISSGAGRSADTTTITLDGADMVTVPGETPDTVLQQVLEHPLRDRPIQIGLIVLDTQTNQPIGLVPEFVGIIDNAPFFREKTATNVDVRLELKLASFRVFAQRRFSRVYSDTDHQSRFPGDRCARWISDVVFRLGKYSWNKEGANAPGTVGGGGGGSPFGPGFRGPNLQLF